MSRDRDRERVGISRLLRQVDVHLAADILPDISQAKLNKIMATGDLGELEKLFFAGTEFTEVEALIDEKDIPEKLRKKLKPGEKFFHAVSARGLHKSESKKIEDLGDQIQRELAALDRGEVTPSFFGAVALESIWQRLNVVINGKGEGSRHANRYMALLQFAICIGRYQYWLETAEILAKRKFRNPMAPDAKELITSEAAAAYDAAYAYMRAALASVSRGEEAGRLGRFMRQALEISNDDGGTAIVNQIGNVVVNFLAEQLGPNGLRNALKGRPQDLTGKTIDGTFLVNYQHQQDQPYTAEMYGWLQMAFPVAVQNYARPLLQKGAIDATSRKGLQEVAEAHIRYFEAKKVAEGLPAGDIDLVLALAESMDPALFWDMFFASTTSSKYSEVYGRRGMAEYGYASPENRPLSKIMVDSRADYGRALSDNARTLSGDFGDRKRVLHAGWMGRGKIQAQAGERKKLATKVEQSRGGRLRIFSKDVRPAKYLDALPAGESIGLLTSYARICEKEGLNSQLASEFYLAASTMYDHMNQIITESKSDAIRTLGIEWAISTLIRLSELQACAEPDSTLFTAFGNLIRLWNLKFVGWFVQSYVRSTEGLTATNGAYEEARSVISAIARSQGDTNFATDIAVGAQFFGNQTKASVPPGVAMAGLLPRMLRVGPRETVEAYYNKLFQWLDDASSGMFEANPTSPGKITALQIVGNVVWFINNAYGLDAVQNDQYTRHPKPAETEAFRLELTRDFLARVIGRFKSQAPGAVYQSLKVYGDAIRTQRIPVTEDLSLTALVRAGVPYPGVILLLDAFRILTGDDAEITVGWFDTHIKPQIVTGFAAEPGVVGLLTASSTPESLLLNVTNQTRRVLGGVAMAQALRQHSAEISEELAPSSALTAQLTIAAGLIQAAQKSLSELPVSATSAELFQILRQLAQSTHTLPQVENKPEVKSIPGKEGKGKKKDKDRPAMLTSPLNVSEVFSVLAVRDELLVSRLGGVVDQLLQAPSVRALEESNALITTSQTRLVRGQIEAVLQLIEARIAQSVALAQEKQVAMGSWDRLAIAEEVGQATAAVAAHHIIAEQTPQVTREVAQTVDCLAQATMRLFGRPVSNLDLKQVLAELDLRTMPLM